MPFKPTSLPAQIAAARSIEREQVDANPTSFAAGAAQRAKETSAKWTQANIRNPATDSAAPWFSGTQPFSELRFQNSKNFDGWKDRFTSETDMGWKFVPPPADPATSDSSAPQPSNQEAKP